MPVFSRHLLAGLLGLGSLFFGVPARAWIETSVLSDAVTVEVEPSGRAIVSHDLWMKIRGGPLKGTELDGVDSDAEPLPEATVAKIGNAGTESTKALLLSRGDDDTLRVEVEDPVGLRNGTYAFRFKYSTDLRQKSRITLRGSWAEIAWVGPRYQTGLDVAKVTFRLPHTAFAPRPPESDPGLDELAQGELPSSALLSTLRRGADFDELELVRPHVAKGEPVLWSIWASPAQFAFLSESKHDRAVAGAPTAATPRSPLGKGIPLLLGACLAILTAVVVLAKQRAVSQLETQQHCVIRPWLPVGITVRAIASGVLLGAGLLLAVRFDTPTCGALLVLLASLCMGYRKPAATRGLRGPGRWLPISQEEAFPSNRPGQRGSLLEISSGGGKGVLFGWTLLTMGIGFWLFKSQPYLSVLSFLGTVMAWPTWLTGTSRELPKAVERAVRRELLWYLERLAKKFEIRVHAIGRFGEGQAEPDEVRLKIPVGTRPSGLLALEVASSGIGLSQEACLLIRVKEDSPAHRACQGTWTFARGRSEEERVATFAPTLGARSRIVAEVEHLLGFEQDDPGGYFGSRPCSRANSKRSRGKGSNASNASKPSVPDQATRAA